MSMSPCDYEHIHIAAHKTDENLIVHGKAKQVGVVVLLDRIKIIMAQKL